MSERTGEERGMRRLYATALELGPLLLFFVVNGRWGIFVGTAVFIVATAIALPCYRWLEKRWPVMPLVGGFFVLVFGGLTIWLQDDTFIKLKPTIVNCLFGAILGGGLLFLQRPLLKPIFGAAFIPTDSKLSKPLTVLAQMGAGIFIGGGGSSLAGWTNAPVICGIVFLLSSSPGIVIALGPLALSWVRKRLGVENA